MSERHEEGKPRQERSRNGRRERALLLGLLTAVVLALGGVIALGVQALDAARAVQQVRAVYAAGAQAATSHLEAYARTGRESFFRQYEQALAVPLAAGEARRLLVAPEADRAEAAAALARGGYSAEDADGVARLTRLAAGTEPGRELLDVWAAADEQLEHIASLGRRVRLAVTADGAEEAYVAALLAQLSAAEAGLDRLAPRFEQAQERLVQSIEGAVHGSILLGALLVLLAAWVLASRLVHRLASSEERFRATFENAAVGVAHVGVDGRFIRVNDRLCEILGYAREELVGRPVAEVTHPEDVEPSADLARRLAAGAIPSYALEKRYLHKEGYVVWAHLTVSTMQDPDGETRCIGVVEDITHRKAADELLRESEERFRQLAEHLDGAIWMLDAQARQLLYASPRFEEIWGVSRDAVYADVDVLAERVHEADRARFRALVHGALDRKAVLEVRIVREDGALRWLRTATFPVRDERGEVYRLVGITEDVTEHVLFEREREARKRAEEVLRVKAAFLRNVSHEIRTPLTTILGFANVLREEAAGDEQREHAGIIERNARHLQETVERVIDLAQLESGALVTWPQETDFVAEVQAAAAVLRPMARLRRLELEAAGPEEGLPGRVDRGCLQRILGVLIGNGIRQTESGGVYIWVEAAGPEVVIQVRDTGAGVNPALLPHFHGADALAYARARAEMELDLDFIKRLTDALGGILGVESVPGRGSIFTLRLPRTPRPAPGAEPGLGDWAAEDAIAWRALEPQDEAG